MYNNNPLTPGHPLSSKYKWRDEVIHLEDSSQQTLLEDSGKVF